MSYSPMTHQRDGQPIPSLSYTDFDLNLHPYPNRAFSAVHLHTYPAHGHLAHAQPRLAHYRWPWERLGRAIALLLGARLLTMGVGWLLLGRIVSPSVIFIVLLIGAGVAIFAYWSTTSYPLARLKTPTARFYGVVAGVGFLLGLF